MLNIYVDSEFGKLSTDQCILWKNVKYEQWIKNSV